MTKRNQKNERRPHDFYATPKKAVYPLLTWVEQGSYFCEPCYGKGDLAYWLTTGPGALKLEKAYELQSIEELALDYPPDYDHSQGIQFEFDALNLAEEHVTGCDYIITNPPWSRDLLHPMIDVFRNLRPTWLLFDTDWASTKQARRFLPYCSLIVSVGRLKWIPDSPHSGLDNCAWYRFDKEPALLGTTFVNPEI